jgi:hypothetical protein
MESQAQIGSALVAYNFSVRASLQPQLVVTSTIVLVSAVRVMTCLNGYGSYMLGSLALAMEVVAVTTRSCGCWS